MKKSVKSILTLSLIATLLLPVVKSNSSVKNNNHHNQIRTFVVDCGSLE
ncbi:MAG: hypothetical protein SPJ62_15490 [Inconstantimicrobium porci]|nr:hypothetical protein [Inconstantimicrobium porci]MDY5913374.1 hypothetical protein [Inconstantimicrobium porci]